MPEYSPKQWIVNNLLPIARTGGGLGNQNFAALQKGFPGSPIYRGELTDTEVVKQFQNVVNVGDPVAGRVAGDDGGHTFGRVDLDYRSAPDLNAVVVGGGGKPGSPYAPNIASPPEGQNPADIPATGVEATELAKGSGGPFVGDGFANPKNTSSVISQQKIGSLVKGSSTPTRST